MTNAYIKNTTFHDAYLELDETTINGQFEQAIEQSIALSIKYEAFNVFVKKMTQVDHVCYECRRHIKVDVSKILKYNNDINSEEFLCDAHKSKYEISEKSIPYIKYKNNFMSKLGSILMESSASTLQKTEIWETMIDIMKQ